jgi:hypothetical protein
MGLIKDEHGVYHVRRKVPKRPRNSNCHSDGCSEAACLVAQGGVGRERREAGWGRAKPVMMKFDGILAKAEAQLGQDPPLVSLRNRLSSYRLRSRSQFRGGTHPHVK